MLNRLKSLLSQPDPNLHNPEGSRTEDLQLAAATLLVEAARMDDAIEAEERARIHQLVGERFGLTREDAAEVVAEAERMSAEAVEWQSFTRTLKERFSEAERVQMIEMLWEVVYADGELHHLEASLLRRITGLLYVSDRDSGEARKRVLERRGAS